MKQLFNPRIFFDIDNINYQKSKNSVIFRVIRYWDLNDLMNLKKIYNKTDIMTFLKIRTKEIDKWEEKLLLNLFS